MVFMADTGKIEENVARFFDAFNRLGPDEKLYFLAEIDRQMKGKGEKDKKLFLSLIKAAREGRTFLETLEELKRV